MSEAFQDVPRIDYIIFTYVYVYQKGKLFHKWMHSTGTLRILKGAD